MARLARLRILIGEADAELEDLEQAAFFNLYSWIDTPVDCVEESERYRRKHVEKKELAKLVRARVDQLRLSLLRLQCSRTPPRRTRRLPSVTPEPLSPCKNASYELFALHLAASGVQFNAAAKRFAFVFSLVLEFNERLALLNGFNARWNELCVGWGAFMNQLVFLGCPGGPGRRWAPRSTTWYSRRNPSEF